MMRVWPAIPLALFACGTDWWRVMRETDDRGPRHESRRSTGSVSRAHGPGLRPPAPHAVAGAQESLAAPAAIAADGAGDRVRRLFGDRHARDRRGSQLRSAGADQEPGQPERHSAQLETARG